MEAQMKLPGRMGRAVVGLSGGKDSSATLAQATLLSDEVSAFTLRSGYYPQHIEHRSEDVALALGVGHLIYDFRPDIRQVDLESYADTADLFDLEDSPSNRVLFREKYVEGRAHYSARSTRRMPFVRTCQLCRRSVIRAYYRVAQQMGAAFIFLGMNEWTGLSASISGGGAHASAIRRIQPSTSDEPVWIVHLPFLFKWTLADTQKKLAEINWRAPSGEALVENNSNSCLFARSAEATVRLMLGFSPDTTRLAREVTAGFLDKAEADRALRQPSNYAKTPRQVLEAAALL